jgi:hypothetical protein
MDASIPLAAAIEHNTYAPLMAALHLGDDDSFNSPIERIFIATNGAEDGQCNNPLRQGLSADLADGHRPNNTLGGIPTLALDYSPAWDANLYAWTQDAINSGYRGQLREEFNILTFVQDGLLTGPGAPHSEAPASQSIVRLSYGSIDLSCPLPAFPRAAGKFCGLGTGYSSLSRVGIIVSVTCFTILRSRTMNLDHRKRGQRR